MDWTRPVERTAWVLLAAYLVALVPAAVAVPFTLFAWAWLAVPVIAFGQAVWNTIRARRATEPARRDHLSKQAAIQLVIGLILVGHFLYTWSRSPAVLLTPW
ncbi:hypothetical protein [Actinoplanes sp. HUAS TT8]|uniref:hypothetical protein n=1 Tax=Actinoplanes sp. HUAS TT8 TaxID=3447453 RepID=UPI003F51D99E